MDKILSDFNTFDIFGLDQKLKFIEKPEDFYKMILKKFESANVVFCKSLSFGVTEKSKKILEIIKRRKENNKNTKIILDENRANRTRGFKQLIQEYGVEDVFSFYRTKAPIGLPGKLHELVSVLHSKIYIFDDQVLLSGANLDEAYFTNRMDRYIMIKDENFSNFLKNQHFTASNPNEKQELKLSQKNNRNIESKTFIFGFDREDEINVLGKILAHKYDEIILTTAYLNFTKEHYTILDNIKLKVITSSKQTNTFNMDTHFEKFINDEYTLSAIDVVKKLPLIDFYEYDKPDFTFHCKGIWAFTDNMAISVVGSTNFNVRSIVRDIESNFVLITEDMDVINNLRREIKEIVKDSKMLTLDTLMQRKVSLVSKIGKPASQRFL